MAPSPISSVLRVTLTATAMLAGVIILIYMYYTSAPSPRCNPPPAGSWWPNNTAAKQVTQQTEKPVVLLWFWPENKHFDFQDCKKLFNIDSCLLTDDRSSYSTAEAVLIFHRDIQDDLSNIPASPRPRFQRWIWFNMDSPTNTRRIAGIQRLFNLTLSYRKDADIHVHWKLTVREKPAEDFVIPKKQRLLCWMVNEHDLNGTLERHRFYMELTKYIKVHVFFNSPGETLKGDSYFQTISSCKFFLSFEDSIHRDYITETFTGPLAAGTVPVVLGPPRNNYEDFAPGSSFVHVNDFPDAVTLANFLLRLDQDNKTYVKYFDWRRFYTFKRHPMEERQEHTRAICQACHHVAVNKEYRVVLDLYKWFLQ